LKGQNARPAHPIRIIFNRDRSGYAINDLSCNDTIFVEFTKAVVGREIVSTHHERLNAPQGFAHRVTRLRRFAPTLPLQGR